MCSRSKFKVGISQFDLEYSLTWISSSEQPDQLHLWMCWSDAVILSCTASRAHLKLAHLHPKVYETWWVCAQCYRNIIINKVMSAGGGCTENVGATISDSYSQDATKTQSANVGRWGCGLRSPDGLFLHFLTPINMVMCWAGPKP